MSTLQTRGGDVSGMTVSEAAAYWLMRHDAGPRTSEEERAFEAWRNHSPTHDEAYEHARALWEDFEDYSDSTEIRALLTAALAVRPQRLRSWWMGGVAAALCLITLGVVAFHVLRDNSASIAASSVPSVAQEKYSTTSNERSIVTLSDGTVATLNLDSTLTVAFTPSERLVRITRGQAFFEVAKNPHRPFVVLAADRRVTALGTQFDVRLDPDRVEVVLLEGKISVEHTSPTLLEKLNVRNPLVELRPGQKLVAALGAPVTVSETNARRATSWREGWVIFENETVAAAVAELNRYSERPLVVPDADVRDLRLSGVFRVGQPYRFASIIQELLPVKAVAGPHGETLLVHTDPGETTAK